MLSVSASLCLSQLTVAAELAIQNSSFELPALPAEGKQATNLVAEWNTTGMAGVFVNNGQYGKKIDPADGRPCGLPNGKVGGAAARLPCSVKRRGVVPGNR